MEHRCAERLRVSLPATIHSACGAEVTVTILNLSSGGVFVAVPDDVAVLRGVVELQLCPTETGTGVSAWRAYVVHRQGGGAGLMFDDWLAAEKTIDDLFIERKTLP